MRGPKFTTVDEFVASFPPETQEILNTIRKICREVAPEAEECISYNIGCYKVQGKMLVYFAAYAKHVSIYPTPPGDAAFQKAIAPHVAGKGTLQFPLAKPMPYDLMRRVVEQHLKRLAP